MCVEPAGIYIHIPFCIRKCPYCDFYSISDLSLSDAFTEALQKEMQMAEFSFPADTIYFGGGTPSVLDPDQIDRIIRAAYQCFSIAESAEITIEVNPGTVSFEKLKTYRRMGVNRLNIGVQSFQDEHLRFLGRIHSGSDAKHAIDWAKKAGFDNIGLDLIYGIPGQSEAIWLADLDAALEFAPAHLSCYMLTYPEGTPIEKQRQAGLFYPSDDNTVSSLFLKTGEYLSRHGYLHYEISNFARSESLMSRHNRKYWNDVSYLGFGPSAHSFIKPERFWNVRSVKRYIQRIDAGKRPISGKEELTRDQQMMEAIYLGLRQKQGIDIARFNQKFGMSFEETFKDILKRLEREGLREDQPGFCSLSEKGMLFADGAAHLFNISSA
jgi:oxygen-independent coproporphyrinogen-3 oxidase